MRRLLVCLIYAVMSPAISHADLNFDQTCQAMAGDYSISCSGKIPKIDELSRIRITVQGCLEISFILEGRDTVTGRVFLPASKALPGAPSNETTDFNDNSLKLTVTRNASWSDDYSKITMNTVTNAFDSAGTNISSKKIIMDLFRESDGKASIAFQNNDVANTPGSSFQSAVCTLSGR